MKATTVTIIATVILIILYVVYKRRKPVSVAIVNNPVVQLEKQAQFAANKTPQIESIKGADLDYNKVLAIGTDGPEVMLLQQWLQTTVTGQFDQATENALLSILGEVATTLNIFQIEAPLTQLDPSVSTDYSWSGPDDSTLSPAGPLWTV